MPKKREPKQLDEVDALTAYLYADKLQKGDIKTLRDEVARLTKLTEWQSIETAPKDKSLILFYEFGNIYIGWRDKIGYFRTLYFTNDDWLKPTHWMHLPNPPTKLTEWQLIETAPKDAKRVLVFCSHSNMIVESCWLENNGFGWWWNTKEQNPPTHWMPLPTPPKQ